MLIILSRPATAEAHESIFQIAEKLSRKGESIAVLHIQDASIAVTMKEYCDELVKSKIGVYSLKADLEARGLLKKVNKEVKLIDYKQWVDLLMNEHNRIVSWTG
ncbi:MAG TPA: sulfurtransferase complex subunit TusB [Candidatus Bathyarchaeia archaeon]|nr:sulfurtransferase complex subunit TusB [Candidatus Bathyarchaeia archaeon]